MGVCDHCIIGALTLFRLEELQMGVCDQYHWTLLSSGEELQMGVCDLWTLLSSG